MLFAEVFRDVQKRIFKKLNQFFDYFVFGYNNKKPLIRQAGSAEAFYNSCRWQGFFTPNL